MTTTAYWWLTLGLGLVVALVLVGLLQAFYRQVRRIEAGALAVWEEGKRVAANTATTWLLGETTARLDLLAEEAGRHAALLGDGSGGRR